MVAIVAGQGLGLQNTSKELLGGGGVLGSASQGVTGEGVYVNAATGNLVVRQQDEWLVGVGPDAGITRTYNSLGAGTDDNGDNWQLGLSRRITGVTGGSGVNTAGSSVKRVGEDGVEEVYTWDAVRAAYVSKSGAGAYDTLKYSTSTADRPYEGWTWTDGDTQQVEHYEGTSGAGAKLKSVVDRDGNKIDLTYDSTRANLISKIRTTNGSGGAEEIEVTYFANKNNIESLITKYVDGEGAQSQTKTLKRVTYGYDNSDRLNSVKVDLTPDDLQDTKSVETRYTYHEGTKRLKTLEQFSGEVSLSKLAFEYVSASDGRLKSIKEWVNGQELLTQLEYTAAGLTKVKDALGQYTEIAYNDSGATTAADKQLQLKSIKLPTATQALVSYEYDDSGNVMKVTDGRGGETIYRYDSQGNRVYERNAEGNVIERSYGSANELLSETVYAVSDPDGAGAQLAGKPQTTYHVYDAKLHLRYVVNPLGQVTEHRYNALGQRTSTLQYTQGSFTVGASAPDWGSDLIDAGASGWSITGTAYRFVNGKLEVTSKNQATTESNWARPLESKALGSTWRIEFRTPTSLNAVKPVSLGIDATASGEDSRMYRLLIDGNNFKVISSKGSAWSPTRTLGAIQPDKDYVLEIVTQASGELQMYVYEASKDRSGGFMDAANLGTWSGTKFQFDTAVNASAASPSVTYVFDNLKAKSAGAALPTESALTNWRDNSLDAAQKTAIARTDYGYDTRGQLKTQTQFTQVSTAGEGVANGNEVKVSYTYDQSGNLLSKAEVGADGLRNVTSYAYDGLNRLKVLTDAASKQTQTEYLDASRQVKVTSANGLVTTTTYDEAGHVLTVSQSDPQAQQALQSLGTTKYSYDKLGRLIVTELPSGQKSYIVYDGQGRKAADVDAEFGLTAYLYNDVGQLARTIRHVNAVTQEGQQALQARGAGDVVTVATLRTANTNDRHTVYVYDAAGRLAKTITPNGLIGGTLMDASVQEMRYDGAGQLIETIQYATQLDNTQANQLSANAQTLKSSPGQIIAGSTTITLAVDAANDRHVRQFYDAAGRLIGKLDAENYYTAYAYDGAGRLVRTSRYAAAMVGTLLDTQTPPQIVATSASAPSQGAYVLERNVGSAVIGGLDQHTYRVYDGRGQVSAEIDAEGYVTAYEYDARGNLTQQKRHVNRTVSSAATGSILVGRVWSTGGVWSARYVVPNAGDWVTTHRYDELGRRYRTEVQPQGLVTTYRYDERSDALVEVVTGVGAGADVERTQSMKHDKLGRLTDELNAEGAKALAALATLGGSATQEQKDAIWQQYGIHHDYDLSGNRIATTTPDGQGVAGLKTVYYYDRNGRLTHSINALGEVSSFVYNRFGEITEERKHANRLGALAGLTGGVSTSMSDEVRSALAALRLDGLDGLDQYVRKDYFRSGGLFYSGKDQSDEAEFFEYNAFGELKESSRLTYVGETVSDQQTFYRRDRRGLITETSKMGSFAEVDFGTTYASYDAFGRVVLSTDARGMTTTHLHDRLGRQIRVLEPHEPIFSTLRTTYIYDAFDRVVTLTEPGGQKTTFVYDDAQRTLTKRVPLDWVTNTTQYIETVTKQDVHGQTVEIKDGRGYRRKFEYDLNGQLTKQELRDASDNLLDGEHKKNEYDKAGRLVVSWDKNQKVTIAYDKANRVLTRTVDTGGELLSSEYRYDALGQAVWTRDAAGVWTHTEYNQQGRVKRVTIDPLEVPKASEVGSQASASNDVFALEANPKGAEAVNQVSEFSYSFTGELSRVTKGQGSATEVVAYVFDELGRRVAEIKDPDGLKLRTDYTYDKNGNVVARKDALGQVTRYVYDRSNRVAFEIDATGAVVRYDHDESGNVSRRVAYQGRLSQAGLAGLALEVDRATIEGLLPAQPQSGDQVSYQFYDAANRLTMSVDALGHVTQRVYDKSGNVAKLLRYANAAAKLDVVGVPIGDRLSFDAPLALDEDEAALFEPSDPTPRVVGSAFDQVEQYVYDAANRLTWKVDALGYATQYAYSGHGEEVTEKRFANALVYPGSSVGLDVDVAPQVVAQAPANATAAYIVSDAAKDQVTKREYDKLGRLTQVTDALNYITRRSYDGAGRLKSETRYDQPGSTSVAAGAAITSYTYDGAGNLTEVADAEGVKTRHKYDAAGNRVETTVAYDTPDASTTGYTYDDAGRLTAETRAKGTADEATTSYVLNALGQRKEIIDALNHKTTQDFDAAGRVWQVTDPLGGKTITEYDAFGNAVKVTDPNGNAGYFFFDANNRNTWQVDPMGYAVQTQRDAFGNAARITRYYQPVMGTIQAGKPPALLDDAPTNTPSGSYIVKVAELDSGYGRMYGGDATTVIAYDKLNRQIQITDAMNQVERVTYGDAFGNKTAITNKAGGVTAMAYDKLNRLRSEVQAEKVKALDADGRVMVDASGSPILRAVETRYEYDSRGNQTKKIEAYGLSEQRISEYGYDKVNRLVSTTQEAMLAYTTDRGYFTDTPIESRKYDQRGNLIEQTDTSGARTLTWWDKLNRKVAELKATGIDSTGQAIGSLTTFEYDQAGNLRMQRAWGTSVVMPSVWTSSGVAQPSTADVRDTHHEYDANGRLISSSIKNVVVGEINTTSGSFNLNPADLVKRTEYDASGNAVIETDARGVKTYHHYDALGQRIATVDAERYVTFWVRDASGQVVSELKNAAQLPETYELSTTSDVQMLANLTASLLDRGTLYFRDRLGRVVVQKTVETSVYNPAATDEASRYVPAPAGSYPITKFEYNALGQVTKKTEATGEVSEWVYDSLGREISRLSATFADHLGNNVRMISDTEYNARGDVARTIQRGTDALTESDDRITRYQYGANGLLTQKVDALGAVTQYSHDLAGRVTRTQSLRLEGTDPLNRTAEKQPGKLYVERAAENSNGVPRRLTIPAAGINYEAGTVFSTVVTTGENSVGRDFSIGLRQGGASDAYFHEAVFLSGAAYSNSKAATAQSQSQPTALVLKNETTYQVEIRVTKDTSGTSFVSTLYIYEKGKAFDSGYVNARSIGNAAWTNLNAYVLTKSASMTDATAAGIGISDQIDFVRIADASNHAVEENFSNWRAVESKISATGSGAINLLVIDDGGDSRRAVHDIETYSYDQAGREVGRGAHTDKPGTYLIQQMLGDGALVIGRGATATQATSNSLASSVSGGLTIKANLETASSIDGRKFSIGLTASQNTATPSTGNPDYAQNHALRMRYKPVAYDILFDGGQAFVRYTNIDDVKTLTALGAIDANSKYEIELQIVDLAQGGWEARVYLYKSNTIKPTNPLSKLVLPGEWRSPSLFISQEATATTSSAFDLLDDVQVIRAGNVLLGDNFAQRTGAVAELTYNQIGRIWVQDDSGASTGTDSTSQQTKYNAYGEVIAKGKEGVWQESAQFDAAGRVVRSVGSDGVPKIYVYDANGNITVTLRPPADGQTSALVKQIFLGSGPVSVGDIKTLLENSSGVVLSSYDARGKLTDTYEASASKLFAATNKVSSTVGSVTAEEVKHYPPPATVATGKAVNVTFSYSSNIYSTYTGGRSGNDRSIGSVTDTVKVNISPTGKVGQEYEVVVNISDGYVPRHGRGYIEGTSFVMKLTEGPAGVMVSGSSTVTRTIHGDGRRGYKSDYGDVSGSSVNITVYKIDDTISNHRQWIAALGGELPRTGLPPYVEAVAPPVYFVRRDNVVHSTGGGYTTQDEKSFTISSAPAGSTQAVLQYRMKSADQQAWRVASIPLNNGKAVFKDDLLKALGPTLVGTTEANLEYVLSTVDAAGRVLSVQSGEVGAYRDASAANYYYGMIVKAPSTLEDRTGRLFTTPEGIKFALPTQESSDKSQQPKSGLVKYRKVGESDWSTAQVAQKSTTLGESGPTWLILPPPGTFVAGVTYEYELDLLTELNGQGNSLGAYRGYMQAANSGGQVYAGDPPVKSDRSPSLVRFHGVPAEATSATVQYTLLERSVGGQLSMKSQGEITLRRGPDGNFIWDAAVVALDPTLQYRLDYTFLAKNSNNEVIGSMTSREGLYTGRADTKPVFDAVIYSPNASSTQFYRVSGTQLKLTHTDALATQVRKALLAYRPTGSSGEYTRIVQNLTPDATGRVNEITFDLSALLPSGASFADYDVYYRYESASGQELMQSSPTAPNVIVSAKSATVVSGGPGSGDINSTFNQYGLRKTYVSGQTNFDSYIATKPMHAWEFAVANGDQTSYNEWFASFGKTSAGVSYDLGSIQLTQGMALWNEDGNGIGTLNILGSVDGQNWVTLGSQLKPTNNAQGVDYGADVYRWSPTSARYLKLELSDAPSSPTWVGPSIGEVAFNVAGGDPDPIRLRLLPESSTPATGVDAAGVLWGFASDPNTSHRKQVYNAFGEVARELTAVNQDRVIEKMLELGRPLTDEEFAPFASWMHYDGMGRLIAKVDPQTTVTLENGMQVRESPVTRYEYDALGRLTKVTDARGNVTSYELLKTGDNRTLVTKEFRPDSTGQAYLAIQNAYDVFGDLRTKSTPLTSSTRAVTDYAYDKMGRLTRMDTPTRDDGKRATHLYSYDSRGNRVLHRTSPTDAINASGGLGANQITEYTLFDALGRVRQTISGEGLTTSTYYGVGPNGQTIKIYTDENGKQLRDWLDQAGRVLRHVDMGGNIFKYDYNLAGNLLAQYLVDASDLRKGGQDIAYTYFADGTLKGISDRTLKTESRFEYDKDGHRTYESYTVSGTNLQTTTIRYDELGRISYVEDPRYYRMTYEYDEVGNRRRVFGELLGVDSTSTWTSRMDYWYAYDRQNRLTVSMGQLQDGRATDRSAASRISQGGSGRGVRLGYDLAGNRSSALYAGETNAELYSYTADGYLTKATKAGATLGERTNDLLGRVTQYVQNSEGVTTTETRQYDKDNRTTKVSTTTTKPDGADSVTENHYEQIGTGIKTNLLIWSRTVSTPKNGSNPQITSNRYDYIYRDSALQSAIKTGASNASIDPSWGVWASGISRFNYNVNGHVSSVIDSRDGTDVDARVIQFTVNANGQILRRDETGKYTVIPFQRYFYVDGQRVIEWGNTENPNSISYADALAPLPSDQSNPRNRYRNLGPIRADVDQNYTPISASYPAFTPGGYTVRLGDTLRSIARAVWGDATMWYLLAEANGLKDDSNLRVGQLLVVPNKVTNFHNTYQTQRVYNPGEVMGDVSPTLPDAPVAPPPPDAGGCGVMGQVLMIIVVIVVAYFTAGAALQALGAMGATVGGTVASTVSAGMSSLAAGSISAGLASVGAGMAAAAVGAAAGSAAGQLVGMATGDVQKFSWSAVGRSAVMGAVSAGATGLANASGLYAVNTATGMASSTWGAMGQAALTSTITQGVAMAAGLQKKFDWRGVAASAAAGAISHSLTVDSATGNQLEANTYAGFGARMAAGVLSGGVSAAIYDKKPQWSEIAASSFGSALGDAVVGSIQRADAERKAAQQLEEKRQSWLDSSVAGPGGSAGAIDPRMKELDALTAKLKANASAVDDGVSASGNLTEADKQILSEAEKSVRTHPVTKAFDGKDPHQYLLMPFFDGTWNDRDVMPIDTNPAELQRLVLGAGNKNVFDPYIVGVGTSWGTEYFAGATGAGITNRVLDAYEQVVMAANDFHKNDPDAQFVFGSGGFSRGATEARMFANHLERYGVPDISSRREFMDEAGNTQITYDKYLVKPNEARIGAMVLFDTVSTGFGSLYDLSIPRQAENVLHLTARDEMRRAFPLVSAVDLAKPNDQRILELTLPGAHSDVGGSYDRRGLGDYSMNLAYSYMERVGIPMAPMPSEFKPNLDRALIHDSRMTIDKMIDYVHKNTSRSISHDHNP